MNRVSRRRLLCGGTGAAGVGLLGLAAGQPSRQRPRALALIGDRYHNPDYIRVSLDRVFREVGIPVDYTILYDQLSHDLLTNYDLFVCLRDGMIWPNGFELDCAEWRAGTDERSFPEAAVQKHLARMRFVVAGPLNTTELLQAAVAHTRVHRTQLAHFIPYEFRVRLAPIVAETPSKSPASISSTNLSAWLAATAEERGLTVEFQVKDVMTLGDWDKRFATVIDSGLFHVFSDEGRVRYVTGLTHVTEPGGRLLLLCFSDEEPGTQGPRRVSQREIRAAFDDAWTVEEIRAGHADVRPDLEGLSFSAGGPKVWFAIIRRKS